MKSRSLRVVPDCPQPETPAKPVVYGAAPWGRLPPSLPSNAATVIARVQLRRSVGGKAAEALSYGESVRWEAEQITVLKQEKRKWKSKCICIASPSRAKS